MSLADRPRITRNQFRITGAKIRRTGWKAVSKVLHGAVIALEAYGDLVPALRMVGPPKRLPKDIGAGLLGAEAATWWAISPSLLPRPWWVTAANVSLGQAVGHVIGNSVRFTYNQLKSHLPIPKTSAKFHTRFNRSIHLVMGATTLIVATTSFWRQETQAQLVQADNAKGRQAALIGLFAGTAGYGAILMLTQASQFSIKQINEQLRRWLPARVSGPLAVAAFASVAYVASDQLIIRRKLNSIAKNAHILNETIIPEINPPTEPQRTGSPDSLVSWQSVGAKGRDVLSTGPRKADIERITGIEAEEPVRVFVGINEELSFDEMAQVVLSEMDRTGAFERSVIIMMTSAGTGWLNPWAAGFSEFLLGGDSAIVAMQYSYLPSAVSYVTDRDSPVDSSAALIRAIIGRLKDIPSDTRPKFFVSGESLGAYGIADSFKDAEDLLSKVDGALFTGTPRFSSMHKTLTRTRDQGSLERLPIIDGGKHIRFVAVPEHLEHDYAGKQYPNGWQHPRIVFSQHASDPIVFWDGKLFLRRPDWLKEPGSRGVPAPAKQYLDVLEGLRWGPIITGWQVGLDQIMSLNHKGGHAHQYHEEVADYWAAVLSDSAKVTLTPELKKLMSMWIRANVRMS